VSEANGWVYRSEGGRYEVRLDDGSLVSASLRGRLKRQARTGDRVVIGDRVRVDRADIASGDEAWVISEVAPRGGQIVRRGVQERHAKVVAANVDRMFAVIAAVEPAPRMDTVDRLLVIAEASGIEAHVVINKMDLEGAAAGAAPYLELYPAIGYRTWPVSALRGDGLEELAEVVREGTSALVGPSGVGKSSILNALDPSLGLETGELSRKLARGRHTTATARILSLRGGGKVADTPGFGDVGVWGVPAADLDTCFPEFAPLIEQCRFRGCTHVHEPGCAVKEAAEAGEIAASRMASYVQLHGEASEVERDATRRSRSR
jgi:ribosome biogenesis GTPase